MLQTNLHHKIHKKFFYWVACVFYNIGLAYMSIFCFAIFGLSWKVLMRGCVITGV